MRPYRFRQWMSRYKRFEYNLGTVMPAGFIGFSSVSWDINPINMAIDEQDKNKREIHEGDILKLPESAWLDGVGDKKDAYIVIYYFHGEYMCHLFAEDGSSQQTNVECFDIGHDIREDEIIDSVYENKTNLDLKAVEGLKYLFPISS